MRRVNLNRRRGKAHYTGSTRASECGRSLSLAACEKNGESALIKDQTDISEIGQAFSMRAPPKRSIQRKNMANQAGWRSAPRDLATRLDASPSLSLPD
jgi:hypothetical protein